MSKRKSVAVFLLWLGLGSAAGLSQAVPAAVSSSAATTGFHLPTAKGSLTYALGASESVDIGFNGRNNTTSSTSLFGDLAYLSGSEVYPFSAIVSSGYLISTGGGGQTSNPYFNVGLSQVINNRYVGLTFSDTVTYLPQTPSLGLSGLPGQGDLGVPPVQIGTDAGQGLLTNYGEHVTNNASGTLSRQLTGKWTANGTGNYQIQRFFGVNGFSSDSISGVGSLTRRLNAISSAGASYSYTTNTFPGSGLSYKAQTIFLNYNRAINRKASFSVAAGPQFISGTNYPATTSFSAQANFSYRTRSTSSNLSFIRANNTGAGVVQGAETSSLSYSISHPLTRVLSGSLTANYTRTGQLAQIAVLQTLPTSSFNTYVFGGQLSRPIGESLSLYASYSLLRQSSTSGSPGISSAAFTGTSQILSFGLSYSPRKPLHLGHS